jgi:high-affinity Fe2+/Pb2+ permease
MEEKKGANPKIIVAVQMTSIGVILIILGLTVFVLSMLTMAGAAPTDNAWMPYMKICSVISNGGITILGVAFAIGGAARFKRAKKQE